MKALCKEANEGQAESVILKTGDRNLKSNSVAINNGAIEINSQSSLQDEYSIKHWSVFISSGSSREFPPMEL